MRKLSIKYLAAGTLVLFALAAALVLAWNAGYLRGSFIRFVGWQIGRPIEVHGALHLHLLNQSPWMEAEQVTIRNPPWTQPGITGELAKLTVGFAPLLSRRSGPQTFKIDGAKLYFMRDGSGRANWQRADPETSSGEPLPLIRAIEIKHAHLTLIDERLQLRYDGDLSVVGSDSAVPFEMNGAGTLNQRPVVFRLNGDTLPSAASDKPYPFEFDERSSGVHLTGHGSLPIPLDVRFFDARFDAHGADLRDLYYLVGVHLPNTGAFKLKGRMIRRDNEMRLEDIKMVSGQSDVQGQVLLTTQKDDRTRLTADLNSTLLRLADIGLRAAGRDPRPDMPTTLFSDEQLVPPTIRRVDGTGTYTAHRLLLARTEINDLAARFSIERGLVKAPAIAGHLWGGHFLLHLDSDVTQSPARSRIEVTFTDLQLAQMPPKTDPPPYEGLLQLTVHTRGRGDSLHALAASADGNLSARVFNGTLRASLAEMIGVDLRGLGLTLTRSHREVPMRCAVADFDIHDGVMRSTRMFVDSEPVFVSGEGRVLLDPETLDLKLRGEPKGLRLLRLKAPILVQGTILKPQFKVDTADSRLQLVDRGKPREGHCDGAPLPDQRQ